MGSLDLPGAEVNDKAAAESRFGAQAVAQLRAGFERSRHPMLLCDDQRRLVTGNEAACRMLEVAREDVPWLTMERFTPPQERQWLQQQWDAFLAGGAAEGCYHLQVPSRESPAPVEFGATANVLPSRHLLVFVWPPEASGELGGSAEKWAPITSVGGAPLVLTEREREIMTLVATGSQGGEIAESLFVSPETVKSHVQNAMGKLGSHTRAHAVAIALVTGQITLEG